MKTTKFLFSVAASLLAMLFCASCTNEDERFASGWYPLQIEKATVNTGTSSRVSETSDGFGSQWTDGDKISVRIGADNEVGTYTLNTDGTVKTAAPPAYWLNEAAQTITAWHPATDGAIDLSDQATVLKYVLKATAEDKTFNDAVSLDFKHQLAKIRVKLTGDKAADVTAVAVKGLTSFSTEQGNVGAATNEGYIKMMKASYTDGEYYEANLTPQTISADDFVQITADGKTYICAMDCDVTTIEAGNAYTFNVAAMDIEGAYADPTTHTIYTSAGGQIAYATDLVSAAMNDTGYLNVVGKINQNDLDTIISKCKSTIIDLDMSEAVGKNMEIGKSAFYECSTLKSMILPVGVNVIGELAFYGCSSLKSMVLQNGVTEIENGAFWHCDSMVSINIPYGVVAIRNSAFMLCGNLTSIDLPESVTTIGGYAFHSCCSLTSIVIPEGVTSIGGRTFADCYSLTSIDIPKSVTYIGGGAFVACSSLTSIVLPEGITEIEESTFWGCSNLTSIVIPKNVTMIGKYTFENCSNLESIDLPADLTKIDSYAFLRCYSLKSIDIPNGVTEIGGYAFCGCSSFTSIVIPDGVTEIGDNTFEGCSGLTSITLSKNITKIGRYAFWKCSGLTSIVIPDDVTEIEYYVFQDCSGLTSLVIPKNITKIEESAFEGCTSLNSITCKAETPPTWKYNTYQYLYNATLHVPQSSIDLYKTTSSWSNFKNIVAIEE